MPEFSVLFVDDEPLTRKVTVRLLSRHYRVFEADGGAMAMETLKTQGGGINVVITDMKMEGMSGMTLIEKISEQYPDVAVIASSGDLSAYDFEKMIAKRKLYATIEKPWDFDSALGLIDRAAAGHRK